MSDFLAQLKNYRESVIKAGVSAGHEPSLMVMSLQFEDELRGAQSRRDQAEECLSLGDHEGAKRHREIGIRYLTDIRWRRDRCPGAEVAYALAKERASHV